VGAGCGRRRVIQYDPEEQEPPASESLSRFLRPIPWMIEAAMTLSGFARRRPDFGILLMSLCADAAVDCGANVS
jgi:hypothetical protein